MSEEQRMRNLAAAGGAVRYLPTLPLRHVRPAALGGQSTTGVGASRSYQSTASTDQRMPIAIMQALTSGDGDTRVSGTC
eukprot:3896600-Rhodomonas_salina.1